MTSIPLSKQIDSEEIQQITGGSYPKDNYQYLFQSSTSSPKIKTSRAVSYNEEKRHSSVSSTNNNRLKHLCTRLKRRFTLTKDYRTRSEDMNRGLSVRFSNYKSFSSSIDYTFNEFDWPDFEKVYDSIPNCLAKALPGLDDISIDDDDDDDDTIDIPNFTEDGTNEQFDLFEHCKRGKHFRRNAVCHKLDKTQYNGQLDTFIQQLMVEKLIRTWT
jgi:hypothetical protein